MSARQAGSGGHVVLMLVCSEREHRELPGRWGGGLNQTWPEPPGPFPVPASPPTVDGGITLEKEISKDELLAVLELYREVRGATSDITRLLTVLSQMEKHEVRSFKAASDGVRGRFRPCGRSTLLSAPQAG